MNAVKPLVGVQFSTSDPQNWLDYRVPTSCDSILQDTQRSTILFGAEGTGKSTALYTMQSVLKDEILNIPLALDQLSVTQQPVDQVKLFLGIRSAVASRCADLVRSKPPLLAQLTELTGQFLYWLLKTHMRRRELQVLIERNSAEFLGRFSSQVEEDLYPTYDRDSVRSQFDEIVLLATILGYSKVVLVLDTPRTMSTLDVAIVKALIGWLDLWQQRDVVLKGAIPANIVQSEKLDELARGRIEFHRLRWSDNDCDQIARRWLVTQIGDAAIDLQSLVEVSLYRSLTAALKGIHGEPTPRGWIGLATILHQRWQTTGRTLDQANDGNLLLQNLYRMQAPLRIDIDHQGVWRGSQFISLTPQPLRVLLTLWRSRGTESRDALLEVTGSTNNLYRQIRLLRESIEPTPDDTKTWVYVCMEAGGNYVLEGALYDI